MRARLLKIMQYFLATLTLGILLLAFIVAILRAEAPVVAGEAPRLEAYLSQTLQHPVTLQAVSLEWHGVMPVLSMKNLAVFKRDNTQQEFAVHEVSVGVRFLASLRHRDILLKYIFIDGLNLSLIHDPQTNQWTIKGLSELMPSQESVSSSRDIIRKFKIEGKNLSINISKVFPHPIEIKKFNTSVRIENTDSQGTKISLTKIAAQNQDITTAGNIIYNNHYLDLKLQYHLFPSMTLRVENYLPHNLLRPELIHWLKRAVQKLATGEGVFVISGNLKEFPFTSGTGEFLVDTHLSGLTLYYHPDWPLATDINGELIFQGDSMQMKIDSATLNGVKVDHLTAAIPALGAHSVLNLEGKVAANSRDLLQFVQQSPLRKMIGKYVEGYALSGPAQLALGISIPLAPAAKPSTSQVRGVLYLQQNMLKISPDTILDKLKAEIHFTESGITGKNAEGSLSGTPVTATISPPRYLINYGKWRLTFINRNKENWEVGILHPQLAGTLFLYDGFPPQQINGRFGYISILDNTLSSSSDINYKLRPQQIPPLDIIIEEFRYGNKNFGRVNLKTLSLREGLRLDNLNAVEGGTHIQMTGQWLQTRAGMTSRISGTLTSQNVPETFRNWGLTPRIQSASAICTYTFQWPGKLYSPEMRDISGAMNFKLGKGQILNVGSQAKMDIGRLLTLLSFQSVGKRLRLDFSDLTTVGLNFDSLTGDFQFAQGRAYTQNTVLKGPIARIVMTGSIDMAKQTYQLKLIVTPHLTSSLPIIATIAGGPVAGAATWVADKLFNPLVNKITSDTYTITGPWDKPVIQ